MSSENNESNESVVGKYIGWTTGEPGPSASLPKEETIPDRLSQRLKADVDAYITAKGSMMGMSLKSIKEIVWSGIVAQELHNANSSRPIKKFLNQHNELARNIARELNCDLGELHSAQWQAKLETNDQASLTVILEDDKTKKFLTDNPNRLLFILDKLSASSALSYDEEQFLSGMLITEDN